MSQAGQTNHQLSNLILALYGFGVWLITNLSYTYFSKFFPSLESDPRRLTYSVISVLTFSLIVIIYQNYKSGESISESWKSLIGSVIIIFLSSNGIQAIYANIQSPVDLEGNLGAEAVPFLSAKSWLPPLEYTNIIHTKDVNLERASNETLLKIDSMSNLINEHGDMTDSVFLTVIPESRNIVTGGRYRSEIHLGTILDSSYVQRITVNGKQVPFHNGVAIYEESVGASGRSKTLQYEAELVAPGNQTRIIRHADSYRTTNTYIEVSSQAINTLYRNCGNRLNIQVPSLGNDYNPNFQVDGGVFRKGREKGFITLMPTSNNVRISIINNGVKIGERRFPVRDLPSPEIKLLTNGQEVNLVDGVSARIASLDLVAVADRNFMQFMPQDANYKVTATEVSLRGGGIIKGSLKGFGSLSIEHLTRNAQPGDLLEIEVQMVVRKNFKGDEEQVRSYNPRVFTIPLL